MVRQTIFSVRATVVRCAYPLAAILGFVKANGFHLVALRTNRETGRRNVDVVVRCRILLAAVVKVDEGLNVLVIKKHVNRFGIMGGIEKHFVCRAHGEWLPEFTCACVQADSIMP